MVISGAIDLPNGSSIVLVQLLGFLLVALCRRGLEFFNFFGMLFLMNYNVTFYPINIAFVGSIRIMLETNNIANLFKEFFPRNDSQKNYRYY